MQTAATLAAKFFQRKNKPSAQFHEDWTINVTSRVLTSKTTTPLGGHIFQQTGTNFKLSLSIIRTNVLTKFHEDWTINVTLRVLTSFNLNHISPTAPPPGGHVF
ncbi:hypothetical protein DPMN_153043 [Dreissena polymorpha]|uniref:Uncharacterized protein n=1 Tax=Dreissena polymorpha TaxID=45954 RepID=A0A9D4FIL0_DREPO|nr:hypothetical protein DPMN_153043 [Dreissena polymorpha]